MTSDREKEDLATHVALCDERNRNLERQITQNRSILLWCIAFVIVQLVGVVGYLVANRVAEQWPPLAPGL